MMLRCIIMVEPLQRGIDFSLQILTTKVAFRTVRVKIFKMTVDLYHRYSNESERTNLRPL